LKALRRRQEGATFDRGRAEAYTLTELKDLAGVRVLAFPRGRLTEIDHVLRERFPSWAADPIVNDQETLAFKYCGYCEVRDKIRAEYQIVSMLIGLFWEVEHSAIYKPTPRFRGVTRSLGMQQRSQDVLNALTAFEREFEALVRNVPPGKDTGKLDDS